MLGSFEISSGATPSAAHTTPALPTVNDQTHSGAGWPVGEGSSCGGTIGLGARVAPPLQRSTPAPLLFVSVYAFPPSVNHYWNQGRGGRHRYRTPKAKAFIGHLQAALAELGKSIPALPLSGQLSAWVALYAPDRRRRDIDNYSKCIFDALAHCNVYADDNQIKRCTFDLFDGESELCRPNGRVIIALWKHTR